MRISDWSSDVCSSDLSRRPSRPALDNQAAEARQAPTVEKPSKLGRQPQRLAEAPLEEQPVLDAARSSAAPEPGFGRPEGRKATLTGESRSEERRVGKERVGAGGSTGVPVY